MHQPLPARPPGTGTEPSLGLGSQLGRSWEDKEDEAPPRGGPHLKWEPHLPCLSHGQEAVIQSHFVLTVPRRWALPAPVSEEEPEVQRSEVIHRSSDREDLVGLRLTLPPQSAWCSWAVLGLWQSCSGPFLQGTLSPGPPGDLGNLASVCCTPSPQFTLPGGLGRWLGIQALVWDGLVLEPSFPP